VAHMSLQDAVERTARRHRWSQDACGLKNFFAFAFHLLQFTFAQGQGQDGRDLVIGVMKIWSPRSISSRCNI